MATLHQTIHALVTPDEEGGYVASCLEVAVVTQGDTLDETIANLREAVAVHLEGEDLKTLGLAPEPALVVLTELEPAESLVL